MLAAMDCEHARRARTALGHERGQVAVLLVGGLLAMVVGGFVLGAVRTGWRGMGRAARRGSRGARRRSGHAGFLSAAVRAGVVARRPNPRHLEKEAYLARGRAAAMRSPT